MEKTTFIIIVMICMVINIFGQSYNFEYKKQVTLDSTENNKDWVDRVELFISSKFNSPTDVIIYKNEEKGIYKLRGIIVKDNIETGYPQTITTKWSFDLLITNLNGVSVMKIYNIKNYERYTYRFTYNGIEKVVTEPLYISWTRYEQEVLKPFKMKSKKEKVLREVFSIHREFQSIQEHFKYYMGEDINTIIGYMN